MDEKGQIASAHIHLPDENRYIDVSGDYYLLAVPADRATEVISEEMIKLDPALGKIEALVKDMSWMTGLQYYLNKYRYLFKLYYFLGSYGPSIYIMSIIKM